MIITLNDELKALELKAAEELEANKKALILNNTRQAYMPESIKPLFKRFSESKYDNTYTARYEVKDKAEAMQVLTAYCGPFLPIGYYKKSCAIVTGYPYGEYTEAQQFALDNAIVLRESAGRGFKDSKIEFYPAIEGQRLVVSIDFKYNTLPHDLACHIYCDYDKNGGPIYNTIRKSPSSLGGKLASKSYSFSGGSADAMNIYHIIDANNLIEGLKND